MKGNGFDIEQIEGYVLNRLSQGEKKEFETAMKNDPDLSAEVEVQKDIIQSIQNFRKAELKARLNKIEVPAKTWSSYTYLAASVLLLSAGMATFLLTRESEEIRTDAPKTTVTATITPAQEIEKIPVSAPESGQIQIKPAVKTTVAASSTRKSLIQPSEIKTPAMPEQNDEGETFDKSISVPQGTVSHSVDTRVRNTEVMIQETEGPLQYQNYNNKLFLYGNFKSNPYEVMELNSPKGKVLYLYFDSNFYQISQNVMEKTNLEKIKNITTRKQLEQMRTK